MSRPFKSRSHLTSFDLVVACDDQPVRQGAEADLEFDLARRDTTREAVKLRKLHSGIQLICFLGKLCELSSHGLDIPLTLTCGFINVAALGKSKSCQVISIVYPVDGLDQDWFMTHDIP